MSCKNFLDKLPLFAGRDLDLRTSAALDAHARKCLSCYRELVSWREMLDTVQGLRDEIPSLHEHDEHGVDFASSVLSQIEGPPPERRWMPRLVRYSGWAAALLLGVFLGMKSQGDSEVGQPGSPALNPLESTPIVSAPLTTPRNSLRPVLDGEPRVPANHDLERDLDQQRNGPQGPRFETHLVSYPASKRWNDY